MRLPLLFAVTAAAIWSNVGVGSTSVSNTNLASLASYDFGDAPNPYPTLSADDGARHAIGSPNPYFGYGHLDPEPDVEQDGFPHPSANGDDNDNRDDEDRIAFLIIDQDFPQGGQQFIGFAYDSGGVEAYVNLWVDWNSDGDWNDSDEQIFDDLAISTFADPSTPGSYDEIIDVPASAVIGTTFARARISTQTGLGVTGLASDGEVEDFTVDVVPAPATPTPTATATPTPAPTPPSGSPTRTPTPTPATSATPTPTASPTPNPALLQGDNDCDGDSDAVDALKGLQHVAAIPFQQQPDCPEVGAALPAAAPAGEPPEVFGDVDCDSDADAVDALKILQFVAAIPFSQNEPCTDIGEPL